MRDPYEILGVPRDADEETLTKAYRKLARQYHPDTHPDDPVAESRMKEINAAYDQITKDRKAGVHPNYDSQNGNPFSGYSGASYGGRFADIRRLIQQNRIAEAEELLDGVSMAERTAEWYFLKGHVYYSRGWLSEAAQNFYRAYQMEPGNAEYAAAYQQCAYRRQYGTANRSGGTSYTPYCNVDLCDCCTSLICLNMCCRGCC